MDSVASFALTYEKLAKNSITPSSSHTSNKPLMSLDVVRGIRIHTSLQVLVIVFMTFAPEYIFDEF
jgi:hypothetical protein